MAGELPAPTPLTGEASALAEEHESSLAAGRRLTLSAPEWTSLDEDINRLLDRVREQDPQQVRKYPYTQWLLDNGHVLRAASRQIRLGFPRKYYRQLPTVVIPETGKRVPRVAALTEKATELIGVPVDLTRFEHFCNAYQTVSALTIGELWALPMMLRIRLLVQICRTADPAFRLSRGTGSDEEVEALTSVLAGCITSLRGIAAIQWYSFVERLSLVDAVLRDDPAGYYVRMDFASRNDYRAAIERFAGAGSAQEREIAEAALRLARAAHEAGRPLRERHVGFYLRDEGISALRSRLGRRRRLDDFLPGPRSSWRATAYVTALLSVAGCFCVLLATWMVGAGASLAVVIGVAALAMIPALTLSSNLVNTLLAKVVVPRYLPKLDYSDGIPAESRTVVAVPAMLLNRHVIDETLHTLELNWLGNQDPSLQFVLLTDYGDASSADTPFDQLLLDHAVRGIDGLNNRYAREERTPFVLLHRRRRWNEAERLWMGWERKRGKLAQFNDFLRQAGQHDFEVQQSTLAAKSEIRYVITLDSDTIMPTGTAARLVGVMAHPLNRAVVDEESGHVHYGYSILQPRVEINPGSSSATQFARIYAGDITLDLYTHAVSDVYQDLFATGIFAGKGIYDVDAFRATAQRPVPENQVLSHDLLEGLLGRAGLVSDIVVLEDYPSSLLAHFKRLHRWIRGDWQLLPWLAGRMRTAGGAPFRPGIVGGWQLFDNLRRSLVTPAVLLLFAIGWIVLPAEPWIVTAIVAATPGISLFLHALTAFRTSTWRWGTARSSAMNLADHVGRDLSRWALMLAFLPVEALMAVDAVVRTLYRLAAGRTLLEWSSAAEVARDTSDGAGLSRFCRHLWFGPAWAAINVTVLVAWRPDAIFPAAGLLLLWFLSPLLAYRISRPSKTAPEPLADDDRIWLRGVARSTWRYFEQNVGPETGWLPPDNVQFEPTLQVARQTSPTNIGFGLLSAAAAFDLGYTGLRNYVYNLHHTLQRIVGLEKYRGHLFNWYALPDGNPLAPRYVSTVDSGNLVGALIVVRESLLEIGRSPWSPAQVLQGLADEIGLLKQRVEILRNRKDATTPWPLIDAVDAVVAELHGGDDPVRTITHLAEMHGEALTTALLDTLDIERAAWTTDEIRAFHAGVGSFSRRADAALGELRELCPWLPWLSQRQRNWQRSDETNALVDIVHRELSGAPLVQCPDAIRKVVEYIDDAAAHDSAGSGKLDPGASVAVFREQLIAASREIVSVLDEVSRLDGIAARLVHETDFSFLYSRDRDIFHVGYRADSAELDASYYDLLASEARLASFIAIAKGDVPPKHWVHLGRPLTSIRGLRILLSWSATAFEYLMPRLLMRTPPFGLLGQSCRGAIRQQRVFAHKHRIPWGISESGHHHFDQHGRYQYQAFGVPRLGLKWDQGEQLVVSSYAGFLGLPFAAGDVINNARRIERLGGRGELGFYEALDFGTTTAPHVGHPKVVQSHMAHHQGMILVAIANLLTEDRFVDRFHCDPRVASCEYLLYEQLPLRAETHALETFAAPLKQAEPVSVAIEYWPLERADRSIAMLANARLRCFVTSDCGGNLHWKVSAATRWLARADGAAGGSRCFLRDLDRNKTWSLGLGEAGVKSRMIVGADAVEIRDSCDDIFVRTRLGVSPFADIELRQVNITNESAEPRRVLVCAYSEPVLAEERGDARHLAFSKLFIESEHVGSHDSLVFRRRPRSGREPALILACKALADDGFDCRRQFETDRRAFLGRNGSRVRPAALESSEPEFSSRAGNTLDPAAVLAVTVTVPARQTFRCAFLTSVGDDEALVLRDLAQFESIQAVEWAMASAHRHAENELMHLGVTSEDVRQACRLFGCLVAPPRPAAPRVDEMRRARRAQAGLWRHGISGDRPVITAVINGAVNFNALEGLVRALAVCQSRGIVADAVFLDESDNAYTQPVHDRLERLIRKFLRRTATRRQFGVYIVPAFGLDQETRRALLVASQLRFDLRASDWGAELDRAVANEATMPGFLPQPSAQVQRLVSAPVPRPANLRLDNGLGGLSPDGSEYLVYLDHGNVTPAPWCNVLANPRFGALVSESGAACTWYRNSSEFTLTPWNNDPVLDRAGEALYIRDEETGLFWSPVPYPARDREPYLVRHGIGYSRFEHSSEGLDQETETFVDADEPVKYLRLRLANTWPRNRRLTITFAAEWRLGQGASDGGLHLVPEWRAADNTLLVRNAFSTGYPDACAFLSCSLPAHGIAFDSDEFLGLGRDWRNPAGLRAIGLSGRIGPCGSPLAAYQVHVSLDEGQSCDLHFVLGAADDAESAARLATAHRAGGAWRSARRRLDQHWSALLEHISVRTPDASLDAMLNRWLPYQVVSSRLNGRLGFYQASGGLGFRDQLQDVIALLGCRPGEAAAQIEKAASVQFREGDVLHWWHEDPLRGVRTRCSDDLLWLPYTVCRYVEATRDFAILDRQAPFLEGAVLADDEHERYAEFRHGDETASIYEHCARTIEARMALGRHGLPLIGTGDWNDGLSRVGIDGQGESVWLAWFLIDVTRRFEAICRLQRDPVRAQACRQLRCELRNNVERHAWAGEWYVRGFYDDGSVLGGPGRKECRIDLNAQTWAVIAGGRGDRCEAAMRAVDEQLIDEEHRLIRLLAPPFHSDVQEPGYIKSYPPGVRENGGQYSHAAVWALLAAARSGDRPRTARWLEWLIPLGRSRDPASAEHYRIEPYVMAGDIYGHPPYTGRGGWSWYTGSAAWLYTVTIEDVLGIVRRGNRLYFRPCLPLTWDRVEVKLRFGEALYRITLHEPGRIDRKNTVLVSAGRVLPGNILVLRQTGQFDVDVFPDTAAWQARQRIDERSPVQTGSPGNAK